MKKEIYPPFKTYHICVERKIYLVFTLYDTVVETALSVF